MKKSKSIGKNATIKGAKLIRDLIIKRLFLLESGNSETLQIDLIKFTNGLFYQGGNHILKNWTDKNMAEVCNSSSF